MGIRFNYKKELAAATKTCAEAIDQALQIADPAEKAERLFSLKDEIGQQYEKVYAKRRIEGTLTFLVSLPASLAWAKALGLFAATMAPLPLAAMIAFVAVPLGIFYTGVMAMVISSMPGKNRQAALIEKCNSELAALYAQNPDNVMKTPAMRKSLADAEAQLKSSFNISADKRTEADISYAQTKAKALKVLANK